MSAHPSPWPAALTSAGLAVVIAVVLSLGLGAVTSLADAGSDPASGASGAPGVDGSAGADGQDGADGRDGIDGRDGTNGAVGPSGPAGAAGRDGADGIDGRDGADGADGATGATGATGAAGAPGAAGVPGAPGASGATGPSGPAGDDALISAVSFSIVSAGGGAPTTALHAPLGPGRYLVSVSWTSIQAEYPAGPSADVIECHIGTLSGGAFTSLTRVASMPVVEFDTLQSGPTFTVFRKSGTTGFGVIELASEAQVGFTCAGSGIGGEFRGAGLWGFVSAVWRAS